MMLPRLDTRYNVVWGPDWVITYSRLTLCQGVISTLLSILRRRLTYSKVVLPVESAGRCRHPQLQPYGTLPCWRVGDSAEKGSAARPARVNWCNIHLGLVKGWAKTGLAWGPRRRRRRVHVVCMSCACLVMLTLWSQNDIISSIRLSASPRPLLLLLPLLPCPAPSRQTQRCLAYCPPTHRMQFLSAQPVALQVSGSDARPPSSLTTTFKKKQYATPSQWQAQKATIKRLYLDENRTLPDVRAILQNKHDFHATYVSLPRQTAHKDKMLTS